jgi:hypothetical protein
MELSGSDEMIDSVIHIKAHRFICRRILPFDLKDIIGWTPNRESKKKEGKKTNKKKFE